MTRSTCSAYSRRLSPRHSGATPVTDTGCWTGRSPRPTGYVPKAHRRPKPATNGTITATWLIAQWPEGEDEPVTYWISNLPADIPTGDLVRIAKLRWRIEHDYRELKTTLGLDHFEGRSFTGWHRHVTLVTIAHLFLTEQRTCPRAPAGACPSTRPWTCFCPASSLWLTDLGLKVAGAGSGCGRSRSAGGQRGLRGAGRG
ncbi:transposase [Streptomyces sp. NPDC002659]|uniref:transposase n=1 Tax=Streptomyces sp. NPDC002659 TaxID=3364656 RepID=UPI003688E1B4